MNQEVWQGLLSLESRDIVQKWFNKIHGRELKARRAKEINAAAKQARAYFKNANNSDYSVRPLLTFYGVSSLSRALLLLMRAQGGEESIPNGHGLETVKWDEILSGNPSEGLSSIGSLKVRTCSGLFSDFIRTTNNRISLHVNSSSVDWRMSYDVPELNQQIALADVFSRMPDLKNDYAIIKEDAKYAVVNDIKFTQEDGFQAKVLRESFNNFKDTYLEMGYQINCGEKWCDISCDSDLFSENLPQMVQSYIDKVFHSIPRLYIAEPFPIKGNFSQLSTIHLIAYFLGMLVRYYPTHWISLIQGEKGDSLWPTINRAQTVVEKTYPELVIEIIYDVLENPKL